MIRSSLFVRFGRSALPCLCLLLGGCGTKTVPVSGQVTLDGEPLVNAHLAFMPAPEKGEQAGGMSSYGTTDNEGRYTLKLLDNDKPGAVVGMHRVRISASTGIGGENDSGSSAGQDRIPPHERTRMFEVPAEGTDSADFALTAKPPNE